MLTDLSSYNPGDVLTADQVAEIIPPTADNGHYCDGVIYSGTLAGWNGRTGNVAADSSLGDAEIPSQWAKQCPPARATAKDFTFTPISNGVRVKFLVNWNSAGDKIALLLTPIS